jgi:hypothetical protein
LIKRIALLILLACCVAGAQTTGGSLVAAGGGITNGAANNVIPKSNGTNLISSSLQDTGTQVVTSDTGGFQVPSTSGYTFGGRSGLWEIGPAGFSLGNATPGSFNGQLTLTMLSFADSTSQTTAATGTVTHTGGNLTANSVVLGAGTADTKVLAGFTTDGLTQLNIGPVDTTNNGILGLKGKTSGTATFTAPAVAGTVLNPVVSSNSIQANSLSSGTPATGILAGDISASRSSTSGLIFFGSAGNNYIYGSSTSTLNITGWSTIQFGAITFAGTVTKYNGLATVDNGVPSEIAHLDLTAQSAALAATTLCTPSATGRFRVSVYEKVTTVDGVSSILGGATGTVLTFTDGTDSVAQSISMGLDSQGGTLALTNSGNTTGTSLNGSAFIYAKTGVAVQLAVGYTSATPGQMIYAVRATCEAL